MKRIFKSFIALCVAAALVCPAASAAEISAVMNAYSGDDSVTLFIKNQNREIDHVYFGNDAAKSFSQSEAGSMRTVVLVDNSLSIPQASQEDIKSFLSELVAARSEGEVFSIVTFSQELTYLTQESGDYLDIKGKIDSIEFVDQDSYLTKALYTAVEDIGKCEEIKYTRLIIIADGAEDEALGYTDDELYKQIRTARIPVYTVGCTSKGNEENLKKMFAMSRMSNASSYMLGETDILEILQDINRDSDVVRVTAVPQDKSCDGTVKSIRISFGEDYCTTELTMPFKAVEVPDETAAPEPESTEAPATPAVTEEEPKDSKLTIVLIIAGAVVIAAIAVVLIVLLVRRRKPKKQEKPEKQDYTPPGYPPSEGGITGGKTDPTLPKRNGKNNSITDLIWSDKRSVPKENDTEITEIEPKNDGNNSPSTDLIWSDRRSVRLTLQDMDEPSRTFEYPVRDRVIIGKDPARCQIVVNYNKYVSGVHCEVVSRGKSLFVRDGADDVVASTNGTFVNDKRAAPEQPLPSGSILKLGPVSFRVSYK